MNVLLTGATGYIGGTVLQTLRQHGHQVRAAVRGDQQAETATEAGAEAVTGDVALRLVGPGTQHWDSVHVEDLADLYVAALERAPGGELYIGASGSNPAVREMGGPDGSVVAEEVEETRARLGAALADALLLDQQADGGRARARLGWRPSRPTVLDELGNR